MTIGNHQITEIARCDGGQNDVSIRREHPTSLGGLLIRHLRYGGCKKRLIVRYLLYLVSGIALIGFIATSAWQQLGQSVWIGSLMAFAIGLPSGFIEYKRISRKITGNIYEDEDKPIELIRLSSGILVLLAGLTIHYFEVRAEILVAWFALPVGFAYVIAVSVVVLRLNEYEKSNGNVYIRKSRRSDTPTPPPQDTDTDDPTDPRD